MVAFVLPEFPSQSRRSATSNSKKSHTYTPCFCVGVIGVLLGDAVVIVALQSSRPMNRDDVDHRHCIFAVAVLPAAAAVAPTDVVAIKRRRIPSVRLRRASSRRHIRGQRRHICRTPLPLLPTLPPLTRYRSESLSSSRRVRHDRRRERPPRRTHPDAGGGGSGGGGGKNGVGRDGSTDRDNDPRRRWRSLSPTPS